MTWRKAMRRALYGPDGFFTHHAPAEHFRTSVTASPLLAAAIARLATLVADRLSDSRCFDVVDVGAGRGELLCGLAAALPAELRGRTRFTAVELAPRPPELPGWIDWVARPPRPVTGLLLATEWLDNVPLDVAERDEAGQWRLVLVDPTTGAERLGGSPTAADLRWLRRWVPDPAVRVELGRPRDRAWAEAVATLRRGLALAVDYGHVRTDRPGYGTLTGFRYGRRVSPVPDGSCDLTAHVALDAVAAAGERAAGSPAELLDQRTALRALSVAGARPPLALASSDPAGYLAALARASQAAELTDPAGLGGHWWLLQPVGLTLRLLPAGPGPAGADSGDSGG